MTAEVRFEVWSNGNLKHNLTEVVSLNDEDAEPEEEEDDEEDYEEEEEYDEYEDEDEDD